MLNSIIPNPMTLSAFLVCLLAAVVLGVLNAILFTAKEHHSSSVALAIAVLPAVVTMVIMLVNGNIGAGLAVAGTFALCRFRSTPGTAKEITGLFASVAIGLALGMGYIAIAAIFFVVLAVFVLVLSLLNFGEPGTTYRHLKIFIPENLEYDGLFDDLFEKYTTQHELTKVKTSNMGTLYELNYSIRLKTPEVSKAFIDEIRCRNGNLNVICGKESDKDMM